MAQFSYADYAASKQANQTPTSGGNMGPEVHFMNEFLHNDGDVAIVRFPYHSMSDISFETTHSVTFPFKKYPSRVRCPGDNCPLCIEGSKVEMRFFVKLLVYVIDEATGNVKPMNVIWDRPAAFAEIDIKNMLDEYGDLTENLFKIKRNGLGTQTRYTTSIITNKTVYNPDVYVADFSELQAVDAARILSKSIKQYNEAFHPDATETEQVTPASTPAYEQNTYRQVSPEPASRTSYSFATTPPTNIPTNSTGAIDTNNSSYNSNMVTSGMTANRVATSEESHPTTKYHF